MSSYPLGKRQVATVERRAADLRLTMGEVCEKAEVAHSTWSRAKSRGTITIPTIRQIENTLDRLEQEARDGQPAGE